jgi:WD40 repeat protein/tetratricopeptide (TPR) repeat protein
MKIVLPRALHATAFIPSGDRLVVGTGSTGFGKPSSVSMYEVPAGKQVWEWKGPPCLCPIPAFSPDGRKLALVLTTKGAGLPAVSKDNTDQLVTLDPATGKELTRRPLPGRASSGAFSAGGKELVVLDATAGKVCVCDSAGRPLREWVASSSGLTDLALSSSGLVATADGKAVISLWRLADGKKLRDLEGHVGQVTDMVFSPDGTRLFSAASDFTTRLWHVELGHTLLVFRDHTNVPLHVAWSSDGRRLASADQDGALLVRQGSRPEVSGTDGWNVLFRDSFDRATPGPKWLPEAGQPWTIRDGALVGRQVMVTDGLRFGIAQVALQGIDLPKQVEVRFRFRVSKPMVVTAMLSDSTVKKVIYEPLLCGKCLMVGSPFAFILQATRTGGKIADQRFTNVGVHRKFDMTAGRWYRVRLRRDPERLRVQVDGIGLLDERIPRIDLPRLALQGSWSDAGDEVEFKDLEIRAPASAVREQRLDAQAHALFAEMLLRSEVVHRLAATEKLSAEDRATVDRIVADFQEDPQRLAEAAWQTAVTSDGQPEQYALALEQAESAVKARPNVANALGILALCRYRQKDYRGSIRDATRAVALVRQQTGAAWPAHYAVLALAHHRLGQTSEARDNVRKLRDLMLCDLWAQRSVARQLARETETLLGPPPAEDAERDAITRIIVRAAQDGWLKHDLERHLKLFADDVTVRDGRTEAPGPYDTTLTRKQMEQLRRLQFRGPLTENGSSVEDVHVEVKGNEAVWRARWTAHIRENFIVWTTVYRMRRTAEGWKAFATSSWPVAERMGSVSRTFDDATTWAALDAAVDALKDSPDMWKRIDALRSARRPVEALDIARKATEKPGASARAWMMRGELALQLGHLEEARTALRTAEQADPTIPLPWEVMRLRRIFRGHGRQAVGGVAFHPDGKRIFTCGTDKFGRLWDAGTGREIRAYRGASTELFSAAISPDGRKCAGGGQAVYLWELETGKLQAVCKGHTQAVYRLHFRHDGMRLVSASHDKTARVWDTITGKELFRLEGHTDAVLGAVFSPDGRFIATCSHDASVRLWDAETGKPIRTYTGHTAPVKRVVFSPTGNHLATCGQDKTIHLWDVSTGKEEKKLTGHEQMIDAVCFSADGKELASSDFDGRVCVWDAASGKRRLQLQTLRGAVYAVAFRPDGRRLAGAGQDGCYVWAISADPLGE